MTSRRAVPLIYRLIGQTTKAPVAGFGLTKLLLGCFEAPLESTASFPPLALLLHPLSTQFLSSSSHHSHLLESLWSLYLPRSVQIILALVFTFMSSLLTHLPIAVQALLHLSVPWEGDDRFPGSFKKYIKRTPSCFPSFPLAVSTVASRTDQDDCH